MKKQAEQYIINSINGSTEPKYDSALKNEVYNETCRAILNRDTETLGDQLVKAANLGLTYDVREFAKKAKQHRDEVENNNYALILQEEKLMPLRTQDEIQKSAAYFEKYHTKFPPEWREEICAKIEKKASAYNMKTNPVVMMYVAPSNTPLTQIDTLEAGRLIAKRASLVKDENSIKMYRKTGETIGRLDSPTVGQLVKIAHAVEYIDRKNKIASNAPLVDILQPLPMMKQASCMLISKEYTAEQICKKGKEKVEAALGADLTKSMLDGNGELDPDKVQKIVPTLPRGEKEVLEKHLQ